MTSIAGVTGVTGKDDSEGGKALLAREMNLGVRIPSMQREIDQSKLLINAAFPTLLALLEFVGGGNVTQAL